VAFDVNILARIVPLLAATLLAGCAADRGVERRSAEPNLLPFTYPPISEGGVMGGVRAILQDREGNYWFGSHLEGVCRVDGEQVRRFTTADGLSNDQVRSIQEAPDGSIWFDTGVGVSSFDGMRIWTYEDREQPLMSPVMSPGASDPRDLWFTANESHGFGDADREAGVYRLRDGRMSALALPLPPHLRGDPGDSVTGFAKGKGGRIWIATYIAVVGFDGASFTTIDGTRMGLREGEGAPHVRCVFEDSRGRLWIGNNGVGVIVVDGDSMAGLTPLTGAGEVLLRMGAPLTSSADANRDGSLRRVFAIGEDRDGNIWIGTIGGGAWRYDGRELRQFTARDGLATASVMAIYCDRDGTLWLGGTGVFRLKGQRFERVH
jgi:ligand-binding sensor domain-containing protein